MRTLIVGCGYLGARVGSMLVRRGDQVWGTVRSSGRAAQIASHGIDPVIADVLRPETLESLPAAERVLCCVGFDRAGGADMRTVYVEGLRNLLERLPALVGGWSTRAARACTASRTENGSMKIRRPNQFRNPAAFAWRPSRWQGIGPERQGPRWSSSDSRVSTDRTG